MEHVHFNRTTTQLGKEHAPPTTPSSAKNKSVFFETYTDSPEFTHIDNPVVHMEEELLPEEQGLSPAQPIPLPRVNSRRPHPLSQVSYPRSSPSPEDARRGMPVGGSILESSANTVEEAMPTMTRPVAVEETYDPLIVIEDEEDEEDDEELEDDTFEFV